MDHFSITDISFYKGDFIGNGLQILHISGIGELVQYENIVC